MKLWILRPIDDRARPWNPWYDKAFGHIVIAADEDEARLLASGSSGDEGRDAWLDSALTNCLELVPMNSAGVVMTDFHAA